ncbi:MAG: hypothetical protein WD178_00335, partial [Actinomycetota bacterium]
YVECSPPGRPEMQSLPIWAEDKLVGTWSQIASRIEQFRVLGVREIILSFGSIPFQICDSDAVAEFMEEVAPLVG